ncbi:BMP family protein [Amaricoccus sp.]|uniref:BMP family protein n=1 Tax=Amaricoccus sp. TaxID=1872485 RepID=UPI00261A4B51|nr:BMP family protein [Amaricoccus sp.]HRO11756.1 BMP family protein [Amaricoccus sp.]
MQIARRAVLTALIAAGSVPALPAALLAADQPLAIAMLIPGRIDDGGFMQAGYNGLVAIGDELGAETRYIDGIPPQPEAMATALRELAASGPDMVIAHGGQTAPAVEIVAAEFPDVRFTVVQGALTGPNVASYEVLQEESAWLAGAAAGLLTETGTVGHISGIRVPPGLKGRGAFYHGLMHTNPEAKFLTIFAGDQDDNELSHKVAAAEIDAGADIVFTMLNAGRTGAIEAMREKGVKQIGNVRDWYADHPDVFVASAIANVSIPSLQAARDLAAGKWEPGVVRQIGLEDPAAVSLALAPDVPAETRARVEALAADIVAGTIEVSVDYDGPEFQP